MLAARAVPKAFPYQRHQPEQTQLYQLVAQYYPVFKTELAAQGRSLPHYIQQEIEAFLRCGRLAQGFLRVRCEDCRHERLVAFSCKKRGICPSCGARRMVESAAMLLDDVFPEAPVRQWVLSFPFQLRFLLARFPEVCTNVLRIVYRAIATYLIRQAGVTQKRAQAGAVTLIQRFGSALNLNLHLHMLFLDGVYAKDSDQHLQFHRTPSPSAEQLNTLVHTISQRVARCLEKRGLLERDIENSWLNLEVEDKDCLLHLQGHCVTYRIAMGPNQGRKVFTLQTLPPSQADSVRADIAHAAGFSLHAGVTAGAKQRDKLERLCRYIARPAISEQRLSITSTGKVCYALKTPYRDGTTHVIFEPLDFMAKLAALTPAPRRNLTRYHGVFAPNSKYRAQVIAGESAKRSKVTEERSAAARHRAMTWMQRLKRVFNIDIEICERCGGPVRVMASIEDPAVIALILNHLKKKQEEGMHAKPVTLPPERAPPRERDLFS